MARYAQFLKNTDPNPPTSPYDLGWVAGFLDAESCVSWRNGTAIVQVSNCHLPTLELLLDWFGGSVRPLRPGREAVRPCYQWCVTGPKARALMSLVGPLMREKRQQVDAVLAEPVRRRGQYLTPADRARRRALRTALQRMKRPRFHPPAGE